MAQSREIEKLQRRWQENPLGLTFAPLAEAYRKEGMFDDALELLEIGLSQHPNYVPAHIVKGRCFLDIHADAKAEAAFRRVLDLDPENAIALKGLADLAERGGRYSEALAQLDRLLEFDRNNDDARQQRDRVLSELAIPIPGNFAVQVDEPTIETAVDLEVVAEGRAGILEPGTSEVDIQAFQPLDLAPAESDFAVRNDSELLRATHAAGEGQVAHLGSEALRSSGPDSVDAMVPEPVAPELIEPALSAPEPIAPEAIAPEAIAPAAIEPEPIAPEPIAAETAPEPIAPEPLAPEPIAPEPIVAEAAPEAEPAEPIESVSPPPEWAATAEPAAEPEVAPDLPPVPEPEPLVAGPEPEPEPIMAQSPEPSRQEAVPAAPVEASVALGEAPTPAVEAPAPMTEHPMAEKAEAGEPAGDDELAGGAELVVTETMADVFLRQGHRELAFAVYTQLLTREPDNERIRAAADRLESELRPAGSAASLPAYAAVLTGGQSVRSYFESLLGAVRPGGRTTSPAGLSLGAVFGDDRRPESAAEAPESGESFDQFFAAGAEAALPEPHAPEPSADPVEDIEEFNSWLRSLKR